MWKWVVALIAVVALAVAWFPQNRSRPDAKSTRIVELAHTPTDLKVRCPKPTQELPYPPRGVVPSGALVVRLCQSPGATDVDRFRAPADVLTSNAQAVIDQINTSPPADPDSGCTYQGGFSADVWFGYPDGRATAVRINTGGCGWTQVGPSHSWAEAQRLGAERVLRSYSDALWVQRRAVRPPPRSLPRPRCIPLYQPISLLAIPADAGLTRGVLCKVDDKVRQHRAVLADGLLRRSVTTIEAPGCVQPSGMILRAWTTWGDPVTLMASRCRWVNFAGLPQSWAPGQRATRALRSVEFGPPHNQYDEQGHVMR